jgi:hypothetical protein
MSDLINIGSRRKLFVDDFLIDDLTNLRLHLHPPVRREVVFQVQEPLENSVTGCYNLTRDCNRILLYYRGFHPAGEPGADIAEGQIRQTANLLTSNDGIVFNRPHLGLVGSEQDGSTDNNIIMRCVQAHNFCVFLDKNPEAPRDQRFKAVGGVGKNALHGFVSADGIHWSPVCDGPLDIAGAFDSVNVAF